MAAVPSSPSPGEEVLSPASPSPSVFSRPSSSRRLSSQTSLSNSTSCNLPESPSWHFPGPSSKYHIREKPKRHTRFSSTVTTPVGPVLSTASRAHRRTQSALQNQAQRISPPSSAVGSRKSSLSRFPVFYSAMIPKTPVKSPAHMRLQDSPFSDYFTDEARSTFAPFTPSGPAQWHAPSQDVQNLLLRLSKLQGQLMRSGDYEKEVVKIVRAGVDEIDAEIDALFNLTRNAQEPALKDSALFMDEGEGAPQDMPLEETHDLVVPNGTAGSVTESTIEEEIEEAARDEQLAEAQQILQDLTNAQEELRKRHAEMVELNDQQVNELEDRDHKIEQLQTENEALKSDISFDHSELLFLKLQMKSLELELEELADNDYRIVHVHKNGRLETKRAKSDSIMHTMNGWRQDWHDVDLRLRRRRSQYSSYSSSDSERTSEADLKGTVLGEDGDWCVETVKEGKERVSSILIRRVDKHMSNQAKADADKTGDESMPMYTNQGCQTAGEWTPRASYSEHAIQTDLTLEPREDVHAQLLSAATEQATVQLYPDGDSRSDASEGAEEDRVDCEDEDDCAITTSPSTMQDSPVIQPESAQHSNMLSRKSAWAELWHGLGQLAGTGAWDDEEEEA
ncbi:hypothetical protein Tdes44962_MAKER05268 [Teratosphaeria destructans]|uniref:Uncharacterized protein n=1 Tax=Teratosphaeria destructans TaxID=418781 RepID=A0A9W7VZ99_9PEZI|nr:hypothetical protein Tdes44962_MAKER05268 [Teratosphaeria destructans]